MDRKRAAALTCALALALLAAEPAPACCDARQAAEDLEVLFSGLEAAHPRLYFARSKAQLDAERKQLLSKWRHGATRLQLWQQLTPLVASLGDGHTYLRLPFAEFGPPAGKGRALPFPFYVRLKGASELEVAADPLRRGLPPGTRLLSINGQNVSAWIKQLTPYNSGEREAFRRQQLQATFPFYLPLMGIPTFSEYQIRYAGPGGVPADKRFAGVSGAEWNHFNASSYSRPAEPYAWRRQGQAALLDFRHFTDPERFEGFLNEMFAAIQRENIRHLIIDLRQNPGGNSQLGEQLMLRLSPVPFRQYSRIEAKVSTLSQKIWGCQGQKSDRGQWPELCKAARGSLISSRIEPTEPLPAAQRFAGKVWVLIGPGTFSSAADLATMLKDHHLATLVGEETGGLASSYGDSLDFELPNSQIPVSVSYRFFLRPSGNPLPQGARPDIGITSEKTDADPALAKVLSLIDKPL